MKPPCKSISADLQRGITGGATLGRPALISKECAIRRSAREVVTVHAPRPNPLARWTGPGRLRQVTDTARQEAAHPSTSDAAVAPPDLRVCGRERHDRRMINTGRPRGVSRTERWRPKQADDERQRQETLAGEIHDV